MVSAHTCASNAESQSADFWAGYLSGAVSIVIGNPLDIVKVRLQNGSGSGTGAAARVGSLAEGLRGLPAPVLTYGALNSLLFTTYNRTLALVASAQEPARPSYLAHFAAGVVAGLATFVISTPTELVKCRAQAASSAQPASSWGVTKAIFKHHGVAGFYHGGVVTSLRDGIGYGFYFATYEASKDCWDAAAGLGRRDGAQGQPDGIDAAKILVCGGLAGVATWVSVFPLDVVKTRLQTQAVGGPGESAELAAADAQRAPLLGRQGQQPGPQPGPQQHRPTAWSVARAAYAAEGARVFVRGLGVCCARAFVVNAAQWAVYEYAMRYLGGHGQ